MGGESGAETRVREAGEGRGWEGDRGRVADGGVKRQGGEGGVLQ